MLISCCIGVLLGYIFGAYVGPTTLPYIAMVFPIAFFATFIFFPSTPKHLLRKGKIDKALASLKFYRNSKRCVDDTEINLEFEKLKEVVAANKDISIKMSDFCKTYC